LANSETGRELSGFVRRLIALRKQHAALRASRFLHGQYHPAPGVSDIDWFDAEGNKIPDDAWEDREKRTLCLRRASTDEDGAVSLLSLLLNPTQQDQSFVLPAPAPRARILLDTARPDLAEQDADGNAVLVGARSAVLVHSRLENGGS
jgi:isoamylase